MILRKYHFNLIFFHYRPLIIPHFNHILKALVIFLTSKPTLFSNTPFNHSNLLAMPTSTVLSAWVLSSYTLLVSFLTAFTFLFKFEPLPLFQNPCSLFLICVLSVYNCVVYTIYITSASLTTGRDVYVPHQFVHCYFQNLTKCLPAKVGLQ